MKGSETFLKLIEEQLAHDLETGANPSTFASTPAPEITAADVQRMFEALEEERQFKYAWRLSYAAYKQDHNPFNFYLPSV